MVRDHEDAREFAEPSRFYKLLLEHLLEEFLDLQKAARGRQRGGNWNFQPNYGLDAPHVAHWKLQRGSAPMLNSRLLPDGRREPLTDVFDEKDLVKVITETPGYDKSEIMLDITGKSVEIRTRDFFRAVKLPTTELAVEKAVANYRNGVIEVTIPKKPERSSKDAIEIE